MTVDTTPITIILDGLYRRGPVRHRRGTSRWEAARAVRHLRFWLAQPVRASRAQHAAVAGVYSTVAIAAAVILTVVVR